MVAAQIALLDASVGDTPAEKNFRREVEAEIEAYKVSEGAFPPSVGADGEWPYDGAIISGSQTSVYDDLEWNRDVKVLVRDAIDASIPVLGVCWGHQLVASAMGGTVDDMGRYEIGYRPIEVTTDSRLFDGMPRAFVAFETHSDAVVELPPDATSLATNDCTVQAFQVGSAYTVQFHPEYDLQTARWVLEGKDLSPEKERSVREGLTKDQYEQARVATDVFDNFLSMVVDPAVSEQ